MRRDDMVDPGRPVDLVETAEGGEEYMSLVFISFVCVCEDKN